MTAGTEDKSPFLNVFNDLASYMLKNRVGPGLARPLDPRLQQKLEHTLEIVNRNHPEWDDDQVLLYGRALMKVAPKMFDDPILVESIINKIMLYGGLDPTMVHELGKINKTLLGFDDDIP